jgi:hypothetical protein
VTTALSQIERVTRLESLNIQYPTDEGKKRQTHSIGKKINSVLKETGEMSSILFKSIDMDKRGKIPWILDIPGWILDIRSCAYWPHNL